MDSGNSVSSSGGDEDYEFDSRSDSISSLFYSTTTTTGGAASLSNIPPPQPPPPPQQQQHPHHQPLPPFPDSSFFDPNLTPFLNLHLPWSRSTLRPTSSPNPNPRDLSTLMSSSPSTPAATNITQQPLQQSAPPPSDYPVVAARRSSKKRSRASRRAPTTVLTTDTSNFRAMVQEFTGIPAPPFASSSSSSTFPRSRFDLFQYSSALRSAASDQAAPPYLLRPFVQKAIAATAPNPNISATTASNVSTNNYQLPNQALLSIQNPNLTFHSLLQSSINLPNMPVLAATAAKPQAPVIPSVANYGDAGGDMGISTNMAAENWAADGGAQVVENYGSSQRPGSCKMNFTAPAQSEFNAGEKESGSIPGRSEGMLDSWICSSD